MSKKGANIYKRKDGRWEGRCKSGVNESGKTIYRSCYAKTYREAREKLEVLIQQKASTQKTVKPIRKSFRVYCDEWLSVHHTRVKESTLTKYSTTIERHLKPYFGKYLPQQITTEMTADFVNWMMAEKALSAKTAKDAAIVLKSILKYIAKTEKTGELIEVAVPRFTAKEIRVLSQEEQCRFVRYLTQNMDSCKFGVLFALMTGLRVGEVCALRVGDVSLSERFVLVRETMQRIKNFDGGEKKTKIKFSTPKSATSARIVPLTNSAYELCRKWIADYYSNRAFLLTGCENKYIEPRTLQYRIKTYSKDCGIEDMHFHVLRHTFATRCVEVGFEIKSLSEVLGHSTPRITLERYVHSSIEFKRQNMTKLEAVGL